MSIHNKINVAVIGATGYTGLDLVLILSKHPKVNIVNLCATKNLGKNINSFDKRIKKKFPKISSVNQINWKNLDLVFLSLPNGEAQKIIKKNYKKNNNLTILLASHNMKEVERLCDEIIMMKQGQIVDSGTCDELIKKHGRQNLEDTFLKIARSKNEFQ